jgi:hypothetical protein
MKSSYSYKLQLLLILLLITVNTTLSSVTSGFVPVLKAAARGKLSKESAKQVAKLQVVGSLLDHSVSCLLRSGKI